MNWLIYAGTSVIFFSAASLYQRIAMKDTDSDPVLSAAVFQLLMAAGTFVAAVIFGFSLPQGITWIAIVFAALLYATGTLFIFRGIKVIEASEMTIVTSFGTVITLIVSYIFLGERLTGLQLAGAACILTSTGIINFRWPAVRLSNGVLSALLGSCCYGAAVVIDGYILKSVTTFSYLPLSNLISGLFILMMNPLSATKFIGHLRNIKPSLIMYSGLYMMAAILFYLPIQSGTLVSQMSASNRVSILLTVVLSVIFLKERDQIGRKVIAALLTTAGLFLIR